MLGTWPWSEGTPSCSSRDQRSRIARSPARSTPISSASATISSHEVAWDPLRPGARAHLAAGLRGDEPVLQQEAVVVAGHAPARLDPHVVVAALVLDRLVAGDLGRQRIALHDRVDGLVFGQFAHAVR